MEPASWGQVWEALQVLVRAYATDLGPSLTPMNLAATLALCLVLWLVWRPRERFLAWVFPARVYGTRSFWLDVKLMLLSWFITPFTMLNTAALATVVAWGLGQLLGLAAPLSQVPRPVLSALVAFLAADLALYWFHRLNHRRPVLWAFHALHHSAEEMSPITTYRHHPVYSILVGLIVAAFIGLAQGMALLLVVGEVDVATLAGTNLFTGLLNLATNNLKHSHIALRYPRWLEHILISPAQHQVHHSVDPRHHDLNFGDILALWDWMFGTLYLSRPGEEIRFGLGTDAGAPLPQRHPTLGAALTEPVARARALMRRR